MSTQAAALEARPGGRGATRNTLRKRVLRSRLPKGPRLVGLALAELMGRDDYTIATNRRLMKATGLSDRSVRTHTRELVRRRLVRRWRPDKRFAYRYEPVAARSAKPAARAAVVAIRPELAADQAASVAGRSSVLGSRGSATKNKALSATGKAKAESTASAMKPDEALEFARKMLGPRGAPPAKASRESQLEKQLALRDRARGGRK